MGYIKASAKAIANLTEASERPTAQTMSSIAPIPVAPIRSLLIGATGIGAMLLIVWAVGLSDASVKFAIALALALMYPTYAVMAKLFQDRNKPGALALFG